MNCAHHPRSVTEADLELSDGRTLHVYDTGATDDVRRTVFWHHGTPNIGGLPYLLVHGGLDRVAPSSHGQWLASRCPSAELWLHPDDGHLSVLNCGEAALDWLVNHTD
jgi:pimeloyl-ACP methyl ester carboxylesterase